MTLEAGSSPARPTIRDVAARAGVSKSLVSLVYSAPETVSVARRERVRAAALELGYRPNHVARSLNGVRDDIVGILVADSHNPVLGEIVDAARAALLADGRLGVLLPTLAPVDGGARLDVDLLSVVADLRPAGLLIVGSVPEMRLVRDVMPSTRIVVASAIPVELKGAPSVHGDDAAGIELAVAHLVERGHRRIAHVGGAGGPTADMRARAFASSVASHGLVSGGVGLSDFTERGGFRAAAELLAGSPVPSALVASSDLAAIGALAAVRDQGLSDRVAVTGYDNTYLADLRIVGLTSIDPGNEKIGRRAAELLTGESDDADEYLIVPRIVVRASSAFTASTD